MTGSWRLFLLCLLQGAGCNADEFKAIMPERVTTLSGSCVAVPCSFTIEDKHKINLVPECKPMWKLNNEDVPELTEPSTGLLSTTFRGNLQVYNCTTTFNNVQDNGSYFFRLECPNRLKYNFLVNPVTIQIKGVPAAPHLTTPKEQVVEGTPVELWCSAPSYCYTHPPTVTWTPTLGLSSQLQQNDTVTSTLTFNASHLHHGNNVSCTAAYFIPSGNKTVTSTRYQLSILYAPRNTSAFGSPCLPAREGGCLNLSCTSHANSAVSEYTWYRIHGERILRIGSGSSLSIQLLNAKNLFFCEVRNDIGTEKSNVYKIDIQTPPRILPSSGCNRTDAWVRCSCDSVGRPSPSLEWQLDGKLVLGSEDVSFSQVNLEKATLRSSLTIRAPAGPTTLTCHSSNAAGNTSQRLPVPNMDIPLYLTDRLPWIATGVLAVGLLFAAVFAAVCAIRAWKMANQTSLCKNALINQAPPYQENTQVFFRSGEDIYANIGMLMNTVGPREEPVGPGEEPVGPGEEPVGPGEEPVGPGEEPVGPREEAVGPREEAVTAAGSSALTHRDTEGAADPAPDMQVEDCDVLYTTVKWKKKEI